MEEVLNWLEGQGCKFWYASNQLSSLRCKDGNIRDLAMFG